MIEIIHFGIPERRCHAWADNLHRLHHVMTGDDISRHAEDNKPYQDPDPLRGPPVQKLHTPEKTTGESVLRTRSDTLYPRFKKTFHKWLINSATRKILLHAKSATGGITN